MMRWSPDERLCPLSRLSRFSPLSRINCCEKRLVGLPDVLAASDDGVFMRAGVFKLVGDRIERKLLPERKVTRY
ncbi:MAG: hypothetical protein AB1Z18_05295, partial [Desulfobacterales bacterium]